MLESSLAKVQVNVKLHFFLLVVFSLPYGLHCRLQDTGAASKHQYPIPVGKDCKKNLCSIFYEANFVARKTRTQLNQSPPNFPDIFVFTVPNAIEILFFQIHPKCRVMGQSGKVKGSRDSPYEMEATESQESEERDKTGWPW